MKLKKVGVLLLSDDDKKFLDYLLYLKRRYYQVKNCGVCDIQRKYLVSEILSDFMRMYGDDYVNKLKEEIDELRVERGYRKKRNSDIAREILFGGLK